MINEKKSFNSSLRTIVTNVGADLSLSIDFIPTKYIPVKTFPAVKTFFITYGGQNQNQMKRIATFMAQVSIFTSLKQEAQALRIAEGILEGFNIRPQQNIYTGSLEVKTWDQSVLVKQNFTRLKLMDNGFINGPTDDPQASHLLATFLFD